MSKSPHGGTIIVRKLQSGSFLYFRRYKDRRKYSTGLLDTPQNRKVVEKVLEKSYIDYLNNSNQIFQKETPNIDFSIN